MAKRFKTDYFEKLNQLTEICCDNIATAQKIISSTSSASDKNPSTGNKIFREIKTSLEKDFFAPFEREDIFILSAKLNELSENTHLLCLNANITDIFFQTTIECLQNITALIRTIIIKLAKYPKQDNLYDYFSNAEKLLHDYSKNCRFAANNNPLIQISADCALICKEIIFLIQYILIKNS